MTFRKLITHDNCADGLASAMIIREAMPDIEVVFAQYNTPSLDELPAEPGLLFCDISPPRARVREFVDAGANVLDHHKHARDIVEAFGERGTFADEEREPGVSGALLAFRHVWAPMFGRRKSYRGELEREFAQLVSIRDTWQRSSHEWRRACTLNAVLMGLPREFWLRPGGIERALSPEMCELGALMKQQRARKTEEIADTALRLQIIRGPLWRCFPDAGRYTSDVAELLRERGFPLACGWFQVVSHGRISTVLSLRSDGSVDVGAICKQHGGGGHSRAAGCTVHTSDSLGAVMTVLG